MKTTIQIILINLVMTCTLTASNDIPTERQTKFINTIDAISDYVSQFDIWNRQIIGQLDQSTNAEQSIKLSFSEKNQEVQFQSKRDIRFVQVLTDKNTLVYQMPVEGNRINLAVKDLDQGKYKINLLTDDSSKIVMTNLERL